MKNPIYDLIIGNIEGVHDSMDQQQLLHLSQAVQTRSQAKTPRGLTPLVTTAINFGIEDVARLQKQYESLRRAWDSANHN